MADRPRGRLGARLLGEFRLEGAALDELRSRQARLLLKRLALERGGTVAPDSLVEAVWGDRRPAQPDRDLHVLVSRARSVAGADRVVRRDNGYALLADWWDLAELTSLGREAARRADAGDAVGARTAAEAALALVRGPLLADEPDAEWAAEARTAAAASVAEVRRVAASAALATGQVGDAAAHAGEALRADPYDEAALRTVMRAHVAAGRPASALAEFARVRELLAEELGVDPAPETRALHEEVLAEKVPRAAGGPDRLDQRLVGRADQLRVLDAELERSRAGGRVVVVGGEPGVGKTALLDRWAADAAARGTVVLRGRAEAGELALQPVLDALADRLAGVDPVGWAPATGLPGPGATAAALSLRVFAHLDEAVRSLPAGSGTALLVDDADGADPVTWAWLAHVRRRRELPLLVVVALRDPTAAGLEADTQLELAPLGRAEVAQLVGDDRASELHERSGGNPLLLTELAGAGPGEDDGEVPGSLREAVAARLRRTGAAEPALQAAAVLGATVDLELLAAVLGDPPLDVLEQLDVGVRQAFLVERDGALTFRHELVRLAVAAGAGATRRAWLHRRAAEVLGGRPDAHPLELARHAREGGDRTLAARGLADAAQVALSRLDLAGAERLLDEALGLGDSVALRLQRSRVRMSRGDLDGADADAVAAMAGDTTGEALELRAWVARNRHDLDGAIRLGRAAAAAATDPTIRASSLIAVAFGHRGNGDLRQADAVLAEAAGAPAELGLPAWTGVLRVHQGRPADGLATLEPMLGAEARRGGQGFWVEHTLQMTAHAYGLLGRSADALRVLDRLEQEIERRGTGVRYAGLPHTYRSWVLRNLGDPAAEELALAGLTHGGSQELVAQCHLDVADCLLRAGSLDAAANRLAVAETESGARWFHNKWRFDQRRQLLLARLALASLDAAAALEHGEAVVMAAEERGDRRYAVLGRLVHATATARLGRPVDGAAVAADLDVLGEVASLEGWWLAADVADATGSGHARSVAERLAAAVALAAEDRAEPFRRVAGQRLG
ncbi:MAG TPA: BTAD domain-containing putative transcriptional regulator [Nocardioides sp.]|uniref:BTAD domain-containing putative transcriptional regulator n=1 Tax=Nocardioides sp. TaxID=35761 RepID=UPI002E355CF4|nr:BTAD domain-containing putative transcriptional regulator [Nocardioides sp.]HEX5088238.1 BTAD domain-containing putative transcriptional regulator [Nocardioides sp.]